jgi:beta-glucosidase
MSFPPDFFWGTATAAYQIEGAAFEDGRGLSVWDMFCRKEGAVFENQHGSVACNHYQLYQEDVEHMRLMGLNAYRFSIAWSRILPSGTGLINQKGIDFYARLIDRLLEAGIEPFPTLFHWDFPYALYLKGGWLNRQSVDWFGEYTHTVVDALSDRVQYWLTLNEPQCFVGLGHAEGIHAPGDRLGIVEFLTVGHHALMAHGRSVEVIRQTTKQPCRIGFAPVGEIGIPVSHQPADIEAARSYTFDAAKHPIWNNTWWEDPVLKGTYPTHQLMQYEQLGFSFHPDDLRQIHQPVDFF